MSPTLVTKGVPDPLAGDDQDDQAGLFLDEFEVKGTSGYRT
jgi:hypothetical protein